MTRVRQVATETVLRRALEGLRTLSATPTWAAAPHIGIPKLNGTRRVSGLHWLLLTIGRAASRNGLDRLGHRASVAVANASPNSTKANIAAAAACRRAGDMTGALLYLRRAAAQDDESMRGSWELAKFLLRLVRDGADEKTQRELLTALDMASQSSDPVIRHTASLSLSNALYERGEYDRAETAADVAFSAAPKDPRAMRAKANSMVPQNRFGEAEVLYRKILAHGPADAEIIRKVQILEGLSKQCRSAGTSAAAVTSADSNQPLLIGVGSGIGDILHATPMIRNIARRSGTKVEVVVAGDYPNTEFLLGNERYVSRVWPVCRAVLERRYQTVCLTHFFGSLRLAFQTDRMVTSAEWRTFRAGMLHDTLLNLEAAKHLLGIPYDEADCEHYFAGDLVWRPPAEPLVGLHAGSKSGRWLSKRWPYFAGLAERLAASGIRVASFGTPDEYVPGTEDRTGGTIEEMSRAILACSHFVSNDSGPMHIASALGMPVLALYGPTDVLSHLPLRTTTTALVLDKSCAPCAIKDHRYFVSGACKCIAEIPLEAVEARVVEMVAKSAGDEPREPAALRSEGVG